MKNPSILIIGNDSQAGTYILRIRLKENTTLKFGRFKKGKLISLPAGTMFTSALPFRKKDRLHWRDDLSGTQREVTISSHILSEK